MNGEREQSHARDWVAIILAVGIATAINAITIAVLYEAIFRTGSAGLSENATQILTTAFGGMIGVLGSYVGFRAGQASSANGTTAETPAKTPTKQTGDGRGEPSPPG